MSWFDAEATGNPVRDLWNRLRRVPGGKRVYSRLIGMAAPYTGTIRAHVIRLDADGAEVRMNDRPGLRNHLRSVHAVALVNLAELAGNLCLAYGLPDDARFIVAGLSITYVKKARGPITGRCSFRVESSERREYEVPVELLDASGEVVARATLRTLVGPKKRSGSA